MQRRGRKSSTDQGDKKLKKPSKSEEPQGRRRASKSYEMPEDVIEAIQSLKRIALKIGEQNKSTNESETGKKRRSLPQLIREELIRNDEIFKAESDRHGTTATNAILKELMGFLHPFTARENLRGYLVGRMGGKSKEDIVFNTKKLKELLANLKPPKDITEENGTQKFLENISSDLKTKVYKQIMAGLKVDPITSERGMEVLQEISSCFPQGTINEDSLRQLVDEQEKALESRKQVSVADGEDGTNEKPTKPDLQKGPSFVDSISPEIGKATIEDIIKKSVEHGVSEDSMKALFESDGAKNEFLNAAYRMLAVAGPTGLRLSYIAKKGQDVGLVRTTLGLKSVSAALSKLIKGDDQIVGLKHGYPNYALRSMPGVIPAEKDGEDSQDNDD